MMVISGQHLKLSQGRRITPILDMNLIIRRFRSCHKIGLFSDWISIIDSQFVYFLKKRRGSVWGL